MGKDYEKCSECNGDIITTWTGGPYTQEYHTKECSRSKNNPLQTLKSLSDFDVDKIGCDIYERYNDEDLADEQIRLNKIFQQNTKVQNTIMHNLRNISFVMNVKSK